MDSSELLKHLAAVLESLAVPYLVTGSMATIAYGEPRFTNDIDVVVDLRLSQVPALCAAFPAPDYYCPEAPAEEAVRRGDQFNIIHPASGLKIDMIVAKASDFDRSRLARGVRQAAGPDFDATFAAPEDVIIKKLEYFREGGSEKHLRDVVGVLKVRGDRIDHEYLAGWVGRLRLEAEWELVTARL